MFRILGLQEIIKNSVLDKFQNQLNTFESLNDDVEDFIRRKAVDYENRAFCRTFLVLDEDMKIAAYFTLGLKNLAFQDYVSNKKKKAIHGISSDVSNVPVILVGQLSKNNRFDSELSGDLLLTYALNMVRTAQKVVGGRVCLVETPNDETNQKVIDFYEKYGFVKLQTDDNETMQQMIINIK